MNDGLRKITKNYLKTPITKNWGRKIFYFELINTIFDTGKVEIDKFDATCRTKSAKTSVNDCYRCRWAVLHIKHAKKQRAFARTGFSRGKTAIVSKSCV